MICNVTSTRTTSDHFNSHGAIFSHTSSRSATYLSKDIRFEVFRKIPIVQISSVEFSDVLDGSIHVGTTERRYQTRHLLIEIVVGIVDIEANRVG